MFFPSFFFFFLFCGLWFDENFYFLPNDIMWWYANQTADTNSLLPWRIHTYIHIHIHTALANSLIKSMENIYKRVNVFFSLNNSYSQEEELTNERLMFTKMFTKNNN